jgi:molybdopterin/thiamine biosynthesis adenylyltransferase
VGELERYLAEHADGDLLPWQAQHEAAHTYGVSVAQVEETALRVGLLPARYQRNRRTVSLDEQARLFGSAVAVIGCGGLGGYIIEELARLGVGHLTVVDPDVFEEHNLNRQLLSAPALLGTPKVEAAVWRVGEINPSVRVFPFRDALTAANGRELLAGARVAVDALDTIPARLSLAQMCGFLGIPLVHGTIAGWYGQVTTQFPGEDTISKMYRRCPEEKGVETMLGNPSFTPAVVASLEVAEVCKILLGRGTTLQGRVLTIDLLTMVFEEIMI